MQFSSKEDIEAPVEAVFAMLSEFETFERSAIRRGADVQRIGQHLTLQAGMEWQAKFMMRGKSRDLKLKLTELEYPNAMRFDAVSQGLDGVLALDLLPLSPRRTRIAVALNLKPKTLSARLLIQSLKLAKTNLTKRFKLKVAAYAKGLEERHQRTV